MDGPTQKNVKRNLMMHLAKVSYDVPKVDTDPVVTIVIIGAIWLVLLAIYGLLRNQNK